MNLGWLRRELEARDISQATLAENIGLTSVQVNKVLTGYRALQSSEADKIRRYFGYRIPEEPPVEAPICGVVHNEAVIHDLALDDDFYQRQRIAVPDIIPATHACAVRVREGAMLPVFEDGDALIFVKPTRGVASDAIGKNCICQDFNGNTSVRRLRRGTSPGKYNLLAINPEADCFYDVSLVWATRILLHLPKSIVHITGNENTFRPEENAA